MSERVVVTGVGVVAGGVVGGWDRFCAFLEASAATPCARPGIAADVLRTLVDESEARRLSRVCQLTVAASRLALADADLAAGEDLGLVVGTEFGDLRSTVEFADGYLDRGPAGLSALLFPNTVMNTMAASTAIAVRARAATLTLNAPAVAGELAVAHAASTIRAGRAERVIAGGVDELDPVRDRVLQELGAMDDARSEGAAVLVLESLSSARARDARLLAEVRGVAWGALPAHPSAVGRTTASPVIARAVRAASLGEGDIGWIYTSEGGDRARAEWERAVLTDAFGGRPPAMTGLGRLVGHGAGSGAMRVAAAAWTVGSGRFLGEDGQTPSPLSARTGGPGLVSGLARGGTQVAVVVGQLGD